MPGKLHAEMLKFQDDGIDNWRNEKFKLKMAVGGPRVNKGTDAIKLVHTFP